MKQIVITCIMCRKEQAVEVPVDGLERWYNGELIQNALPLLDAAKRELLISKTCPKCWDNLTGGDL